MNTTNLSIEEMEAILKGTEQLSVEVGGTIEEKYRWIRDTLIKSKYLALRRKEKSIARRFLVKCTGYTESHVDHLIAEYRRTKRIDRKKRTCVTEFATVYTRSDIALLARTSQAYFHPNGRALVNVCKDMYRIYDDVRFERLARLSVSHLYNLRGTHTYKNETHVFEKTKSVSLPIGERRKPYPLGKPGYIRVDSVHQGDLDKEKGVYHLHLVDEVTQWDITVTVEGISYEFLGPALEEAFALFPFHIVNFHSDNGSEYINYQVADLLNRLCIEQTKSRARQTNDQALAEGKHAVTVRPVYGKTHIPKRYAGKMNDFNRAYLHDFVNFHRKCGFATEVVNADGKTVKQYKTENFKTPCEKTCSLPDIEQYLKDGVTVTSLKQKAAAKSHLAAAEELQNARRKLFREINK